jgi:hypothetical protein
MTSFKTPIAFFIFNRPNTTKKVFETIRKIQPAELFIIADGPRENNSNDVRLCSESRNLAEDVDWDCKVHKNYSEINIGLRRRIPSGLNWVFDKVEKAIILEDDCLPHSSFFRFCDVLLDYYKDKEEIMAISGTNIFPHIKPKKESYYFSAFVKVWGWATWRRAWKNYNDEINDWPKLKKSDFLFKVLKNEKSVKYWETILQEVYEEKINSWAYRWRFSIWQNKGLTIVPAVNSVTNIGFGKEATNTKGPGKRYAVHPYNEIVFPLKHPKLIERNEALDKLVTKKKHKFSLRDKAIRSIKKILGL